MEINFLVAFLSGVVSFFAPCVVPLIPIYLAYLFGVSVENLKKGGRGWKGVVIPLTIFVK